ncbi:hypothetical protein AWRI1631_111690 [Saccharomyces cerevisiae AWRI1631]|uniref:Uncharacterized protein n=1 Tax=Saccharomyces cerevisiae (strain AWRI1631) TaxID=545124 RepID=B5VMA0_YEAS6|nr:hypothetical protein AWRI1631_111690 [Saccharomyces cerevisiae AWRI1631]
MTLSTKPTVLWSMSEVTTSISVLTHLLKVVTMMLKKVLKWSTTLSTLSVYNKPLLTRSPS